MSTPDLTPEVRSIGRYRLVRRLGAGGFAVVWLAYDTSLEADVAVKIMAENWASRTDMRERFLREAQLLRMASSRRVVQVFDIGELPDGRPYFVMEYADRGTLEDRISASPLPLDEALLTTAEVAEGVADLHDAGVVHRDVKPSNVLITSDRSGSERLVLADLGVAKSLAQASRLTMSVGSAGYQAPEQAEPNTDVDVRADVYSLGALGYRLVTGATPGLPGKIAPPTSFRADLPAPVASTLMSALAPDREERPATARTFAATLRSLMMGDDGSPVPAPAPPVSRPTDSSPPADTLPIAVPHPPTPAPPPATAPPATALWSPAPATAAPRSPAPSSAAAAPSAPYAAPSAPYAAPSASLLPSPDALESPFPPEPRSRRPRRLWLRLLTTAVVIALAGAGGGLVYLHEQDGRWLWERSTPSTVTLTDRTNDIEVRVPRAWAARAVNGGWNPASIGLPAGSQPGLLVLSDLPSTWEDLTENVDGVFAGYDDDAGLAKAVQAIDHANCGTPTQRAYTGPRWKAEIRQWGNCEGEGRTVEEILLTPAGGSAPQMYVQIRQSGGSEQATTDVLNGLKFARN